MSGFFYGWYFKCQSGTQTLAVIPAVHQGRNGKTCSLQIITDEGTWTADFPADAFQRAGREMAVGRNRFGERGIRLSVRQPGLSVTGRLKFGPMAPLKYDIMGPFLLVPFLECRHRVWSMRHQVSGTVSVNGKKYVFRNGTGYWEGDRGRSFPGRYAWTQCFFPGGSVMLSVADIPMAGFCFKGVIGVVLKYGREYRLATYLGAEAVYVRDGIVRVVQGGMELEARLLEKNGKPLRAPADGDMSRTIHESAACRASYRFRAGGRTLLDFETDRASFEFED